MVVRSQSEIAELLRAMFEGPTVTRPAVEDNE